MKKVHRYVFLIVFIILCVFLCRRLFSDELEMTFTHVYSSKVKSGETIRIAALADLHNKQFGRDNIELINSIDNLNPDMIVIAGDMVNKDDPDISTVLTLCESLKEIAPVYYGFGNHEMVMIYQNNVRLDYALEEMGVSIFKNTSVEAEVKGTTFLIGGLASSAKGFEEDPRFAEYMKSYLEEDDSFKLLITHFPDMYYEILADEKIDLGICGHFHGGQIQIPVLGGLYSVDYGLFPKYCNGLYELKNGTIYVSRGLGNSRNIPRINNRPELAVLDINGRR